MTLPITDNHERQVCESCGMAYEDECQHIDWHVDQHVKRQQRLAAMSDVPDPDARFMVGRLTAALSQMSANDVRGWELDEQATVLRRECRALHDAAGAEGERRG